MKQKNVNPFVLWFVKLTGGLPAYLLFKPKVYYEDKSVQSARLKGGAILMSNHKSLLDFVLYLVVFFGKTLRFVMAEVLFNKGKIFSWFLFALGGIYVNRDIFDMLFISESVKILRRGGIVGIFPEGRLPINGKPWPFKPGVVYLAINSGAPIIPVYTDGNYGIFKRATVVIGKPIQLLDFCKTENPSKEEITELVSILEKKTAALKEIAEGYEK